jgi:hypothetical protein
MRPHPHARGQAHGLAHRRVVGHVHEQDLRRAQTQQVLHRAQLRLERLVQAAADGVVDLPQPAQHRGREVPRERLVTRRELLPAGRRLDRRVEAVALAQHLAQHVERGPARLAAGRRGGGCGLGRGHGGCLARPRRTPPTLAVPRMGAS